MNKFFLLMIVVVMVPKSSGLIDHFHVKRDHRPYFFFENFGLLTGGKIFIKASNVLIDGQELTSFNESGLFLITFTTYYKIPLFYFMVFLHYCYSSDGSIDINAIDVTTNVIDVAEAVQGSTLSLLR
eukprot:TRINITY_DN3018_c0_g1_i1.p1 TRINITY_DN3018_c0_g1~~TRINITY_DN3018_c0_g1_i1.p1  ORF type:complete len:127 (-),score=12.25 TRINITY_DN3018_c0_g1_i1:102-482(-)